MTIIRFPIRMRKASTASDMSVPAVSRSIASGFGGLDAAIGGGFRYGAVHEVFGASQADAAAVTGLALILASLATMGSGSRCAWIGASGVSRLRLYPPGLAELAGSMPVEMLVSLSGGPDMLRAALRAASQPGLVVVESWGDFAGYDLTASRRLHLAAESSGAMLLLLRIGAEPVPSAALTRWAVRSAPSIPLAANAPGYPAFDLTLLRQRGGPSGQSWRLFWDRNVRRFHESALPGAVVPLSGGGAAQKPAELPMAG